MCGKSDFNYFQNFYDEYDGFVVLHGTDTMSYTASALSFMFENIGKCIVLTGSQVSQNVPQIVVNLHNFCDSLASPLSRTMKHFIITSLGIVKQQPLCLCHPVGKRQTWCYFVCANFILERPVEWCHIIVLSSELHTKIFVMIEAPWAKCPFLDLLDSLLQTQL